MVRICCVPLCSSRVNVKHKNVIYHKFPQNIDLKRKWGAIIQKFAMETVNRSVNLGNSSRVCSLHFKAEDYRFSRGHVKANYLKPNAKPTIFHAEKTGKNDESSSKSSKEKSVKNQINGSKDDDEKLPLLHSSPSDQDLNSALNNEHHRCHLCTFETTELLDYATHVKTHADSDGETTDELFSAIKKSEDKPEEKDKKLCPLTAKMVYHCPKCNFWSRTISLFHHHSLRHLTEQPYKCTRCSYVAATQKSVKRHIFAQQRTDICHMGATSTSVAKIVNNQYQEFFKLALVPPNQSSGRFQDPQQRRVEANDPVTITNVEPATVEKDPFEEHASFEMFFPVKDPEIHYFEEDLNSVKDVIEEGDCFAKLKELHTKIIQTNKSMHEIINEKKKEADNETIRAIQSQVKSLIEKNQDTLLALKDLHRKKEDNCRRLTELECEHTNQKCLLLDHRLSYLQDVKEGSIPAQGDDKLQNIVADLEILRLTAIAIDQEIESLKRAKQTTDELLNSLTNKIYDVEAHVQHCSDMNLNLELLKSSQKSNLETYFSLKETALKLSYGQKLDEIRREKVAWLNNLNQTGNAFNSYVECLELIKLDVNFL